MTVLHNSEHRAAGTLRFNKRVSLDELVLAVKNLHAQKPEQWIDLHIRGAGDDKSHYVAFIARLPDGAQETHHLFSRSVVDFFCDTFGYDNFGRPLNCKGWSIATVDFMM